MARNRKIRGWLQVGTRMKSIGTARGRMRGSL
jgi:hypothetical protein